MKKRIGSKLYDTETSELVAETGLGKLYQKRTRAREWFLLIDGRIEPLTDQEAAALIWRGLDEKTKGRITKGL